MFQYSDRLLQLYHYFADMICPDQFIIEVKSESFYLFDATNVHWPWS